MTRLKWILFCGASLHLFIGRKKWQLKSRAIVVGQFLFSLSGITYARRTRTLFLRTPKNVSRVLIIANQVSETTRQNTVDLINGFRSLESDELIVQVQSPDEFGCVNNVSPSFDCVVISYDVLELRTTPWWHDFVRSMHRLRKNIPNSRFVVLVQDDYTASALLDHFFCKINPHIVFTGARGVSRLIYPNFTRNGGNFGWCLTSYVPHHDLDDLVKSWTSISQRKWDIGNRVRALNAMFGERGTSKAQQLEEIKRLAPSVGLTTNLSTNPEDVFLGLDWNSFLHHCRSVPSTSGGSSIVDKQGWLTTLALHFQDTGEMWDLKYLGKWTQSLVFECDIQGFSPRVFEAAQAGCVLFLDQTSETLNLTAHIDYVPIGVDMKASLRELSNVLNNPDKAEQMRLNAFNKLIMSELFDVRRFAKQVISGTASFET